VMLASSKELEDKFCEDQTWDQLEAAKQQHRDPSPATQYDEAAAIIILHNILLTDVGGTPPGGWV
jgi:hypothetical protein